jgi:hypothetical protein
MSLTAVGCSQTVYHVGQCKLLAGESADETATAQFSVSFDTPKHLCFFLDFDLHRDGQIGSNPKSGKLSSSVRLSAEVLRPPCREL